MAKLILLSVEESSFLKKERNKQKINEKSLKILGQKINKRITKNKH